MKHLFPFLLLVCSGPLFGQLSFSPKTVLLGPTPHYSGVAMGVADMDGDGRDDLVRFQLGTTLSVAYQMAPNRPFRLEPVGLVSADNQWGLCIADIDANGFPEVLSGGAYDGVFLARAGNTGESYTLETLNEPGTFVQCVNFAPINNDSLVDAFVCHDDGTARIFGNTGNGNLSLVSDWINLDTDPVSDNSGNYGSVWSDVDNDGDLDLYIAKCRQFISNPADGRRINQLFLNNGDGTYTQDLGDSSHLRIGAQSWTADFADIDNDGDFDCFITNHDMSSQLLENDGAGRFTDISADAGILDMVAGLPIQGVFRDFDNDGYVDLLVAGTDHYLFHNNGDKTFTRLSELFGARQIESFALGDLNADGFQDIYAGYAELFNQPSNIPDVLWMNDGNSHHFIGFTLRGAHGNYNAVGAKVRLYSALGMQTREVRAGESYGISNSHQVHFGLGNDTQVDSVVIYWPSGHKEVWENPPADQYWIVEEQKCRIAPLATLSIQGDAVFCSGDSAVLLAPAGQSAYSWTGGGTGSSLTVTTAGYYRVTVTDANGCTAISPAFKITVDPEETVSITPQGETRFCYGDTVVLAGSAAMGYLWNTGDTTSRIRVTESGVYSLTIQGMCSTFTSAPIAVEVLTAPLPVVEGDTIFMGENAVITATGDSVLWYDAPFGGSVLFSGNVWNVVMPDTTVTYWAGNAAMFDEPNAFAGMENHMGTNLSGPQVNGTLIFDAHMPFRLASTKVYTTRPGIREVELRDNTGALLQSVQVNIPTGTTVIDLGFDVPVGQDMILTTNSAVNSANLNTVSPQLRRSDNGVTFPYTLSDVVTIKNSSGGEQYYYYFYNWEIDFYEIYCPGPTVPVTIVVEDSTSSVQGPTRTGVRLFPNPAGDYLQVAFADGFSWGTTAEVYDARGVLKGTEQWTQGATSHQLFTGNYPPGVYHLRITGPAGAAVFRFVVHR